VEIARQRLAEWQAASAGGDPDLLYNGSLAQVPPTGQVMPTVTAYTIYWTPHNSISTRYQGLINRYFQDIGGTNFYHLATQYYQAPPQAFIQNSSAFGASWVDSTHAYPGGRGTAANPLLDSDIQQEVLNALATNPSWGPPGLNKMYFVFAEFGIESCMSGSFVSCTIGAGANHNSLQNSYCAYHFSFNSGSNSVIYANMPYLGTWNSGYPASCRGFNISRNYSPCSLRLVRRGAAWALNCPFPR